MAPSNKDKDRDEHPHSSSRHTTSKHKDKKIEGQDPQQENVGQEQKTPSAAHKFFEDAVDPLIWSQKQSFEQIKKEMGDEKVKIKFGTGSYKGVRFPMMKVVPGQQHPPPSSSSSSSQSGPDPILDTTINQHLCGHTFSPSHTSSIEIEIAEADITTTAIIQENQQRFQSSFDPLSFGGTCLDSPPSSSTFTLESVTKKKKKKKSSSMKKAITATAAAPVVSKGTGITDLKIMDRDTEKTDTSTPEAATTTAAEADTDEEENGEVYQKFDSRGEIVKIRTVQVQEDNEDHNTDKVVNHISGDGIFAVPPSKKDPPRRRREQSQGQGGQRQQQSLGLVLGSRSILWTDIESCFPKLIRIQNGDQYVPMIRNDRLYR